MKTLINFIGKSAMLFLWSLAMVLVGMIHQERNPDRDVFDLLPSLTHQVKIIQKRAGCIKIDAEVGPEFKRMVNAAVKREKEREYCQQANNWSVANMPGCGLITLLVWVFRPARIALTISPENIIGRSLLIFFLAFYTFVTVHT